DVVEVGRVGESVLGDHVNVAAVEGLIFARLAIVRSEAFAKYHIGRAKAARIGAAEENGVARHFRKKRLVIGAFKWRLEHVMAEPVAEHMTVLIAFEPMSETGVEGKENKKAEGDAESPARCEAGRLALWRSG